MRTPTATVKTPVVIGAIDGTDAVAVALFERAMRGECDLAVTTRLWLELTRSQPSAELRAYLERMPPLGSPGRWDLSTWDGGDYWVDQVSVAGDDVDSDHVEAHIRSGRSFFISRDARQLSRARAAGVRAVTPDEFLVCVEQQQWT